MSPSDARGLFPGLNPSSFSPRPTERLRDDLLVWYKEVSRSLPWRINRTPYRVWVSEIMLQQTTVRAVLGYFERFLERFPDVDSLAEAPVEDVLKLWEGLGYYQRARNLHKAARIIASGGFPETVEGWMNLPGVGRSTAGAVCSIALGQETPILDANVRRVLGRLRGISPGDAVRESPDLWELSKAFVTEASDPGEVNQALMEIGAVVCLTRKPLCTVCPWSLDCASCGAPEEILNPPRKKKEKQIRIRTALIPSDESGYFLVQGRDRLLEGLWDVFSVSGPPGEGQMPFGKVLHEYSHFREEVFLVREERSLLEAALGETSSLWLAKGEESPVALTGVARKILRFRDSQKKRKKP
ncbi:A/G-specific adenine glycosylase [Leptospirillum ferriphilum]|uniref:A/G-specific adenine glycosylase n=1 Tax=Leptospirillum ferriphilum TaxID=178606 RepID=UPI000691505A|nr:A/G-specific adenine glycosylase [Leptospirillum ferriphilum]